MEGTDMNLQEMKSDVLALSTTVISHSSSIKFLEEKMGQLTYFMYANPYDNSMTHLNENWKSAIQVSEIVTRSGKYLQEITRPDNVDAQGDDFQ
ncbi:hypothetical protein KY290_035054 [Solanum tuberosum]|uniref:Uncharacterized protein n=1 Tax=Solanum tuberosum TaxID=4113 RepID=A0ABQ7U5E3_SOLTU|nr:hypothetical protein KY284_034270 [Solanum tuberosum]KAH0649073.1 hypothetical protein KY285_034321 [Solanum tuberosum]KAH0742011.1 hypothetical protein KY290_035054 [Solanum tuberosum]